MKKNRQPSIKGAILVTWLLFFAFLNSNANEYSQTVTYSGQEVRLEVVFSAIEKQTGFSFFFNYSLIKDSKPVSLSVKNMPLEDVVKLLLKDQQLTYYISGKTVFIVKEEKRKNLEKLSDGDKLLYVHGRVINQLGESLPSATVEIHSAKIAVLTDQRGEFDLKKVPIGAVIEVTYLGYEKKEVIINEDGRIDIQMRPSQNQLDMAQVVAYGKTSQHFSIGNQELVTSDDIAKQPVTNPLMALEGRVPGLYINQASGVSGSGMSVRIQGQNSIANGNDPLYVVDGVPYASQLLPSNLMSVLGGSGTSGVFGSSLSFINTADIESISILKDADATAIYGSRAANGAILITTKRGKVGKTKAALSFQNGWGSVASKIKLLDTRQYLEMRHEALLNDGKTGPDDTDFEINGSWDSTRNVDWQKTLIGNTAHYLDGNVSISGGTTFTQYIINGGYHKETSVFPGTFNDVRASVHFNINGLSENQRLRTQLSGSYIFDDNQLPQADLTTQALTLPPDAPEMRNQDGTLNWQLVSGESSWINPLSYTSPTERSAKNLIGNVLLEYQLLPGLSIRGTAGYTNLQTIDFYGTYYSLQAPEDQAAGPAVRTSNYINSSITTWIFEPQVEYKKVFHENKLNILLGGTYTHNNSNSVGLHGASFLSDALVKDIHSAATSSVTSSVMSEYKYAAAFARLNYVLKDRYLLDLVARRDGSSRFGSANQFHNFGSVGAGWIFSETRLVKEHMPILSFGKIKGSYGITGSDQIGDYGFLNRYIAFSTPVAYQGLSSLAVSGLPNPYLEWEKTKKIQGGVEVGLIRNRVLIYAVYIYNQTSNQLVSLKLPGITGPGFVSANLPATVRNTAEEFSLTSINIQKKVFSWQTNVNLTIPQNRLMSYLGTLPANLQIGQPLSITKVFQSRGVDPSTGKYIFSDLHGNVTPTPNSLTDKTQIVNASFPKFYGGVENSFTYRQFQLSFMVQFVKKIASNYFFGRQLPGSAYSNQPIYVLNRWRKSGDLTSTQRFSSNSTVRAQYNNELLSSASYSDASFLRLKNVYLSYSLPTEKLKAAHIQGLRVYLQGQNLLTFTSFKGLDPETGVLSLPPLRMVLAGLSVEF